MRRYADDYEIVYEEDKKGREKKVAVYKGQYFKVNVDESQLVKFRRICILLLVLISLLHIGGGFVANRGMYLFYVAMPYVIAFLPLYFLAAGILRLPKEKRQYRRDEVGLTFDRMKKASYSFFILVLAGILGDIIFLFVLATEGLWQEYIYLSIQALAALGTYIIIRLQKPIEVSASVD